MPSYTRTEILQAADQAAADMGSFYRQPFVNYAGTTGDTHEPYTEIVAEWCLDNKDRFESISPVRRESSYRRETHDALPPTENSPRAEENIAMAIRRQGSLPFVGEILDYQVPLKNAQTDKAGKIDLISYDAAREELFLFELKRAESKETMLRCLLEADAYLRTVDTRKLLKDFGLPETTKVTAHPLVFLNSAPFKDMTRDLPKMKRLADILNSRPYYLIELADGSYSVL